MAIITLAEYQTLTGDTDHDTQVAALIPYVQADFIDMCNFDFYQDTDNEEWPEGAKLLVAKMLTFQISDIGSNGDQNESENIDGYSYKLRGSEGATSLYPPALEQAIVSKWRRCGFKSGSEQIQFRDKRGFTPERLVKDV
jgi:hypothetical protein